MWVWSCCLNIASGSMSIWWETLESARALASVCLNTDTHWSIGSLSDSFVELLAVEYDEVVAWFQDATLSSNTAGSVDVVTGYHANRYSRSLTLANSIRNLTENKHEACARITWTLQRILIGHVHWLLIFTQCCLTYFLNDNICQTSRKHRNSTIS